MPHDDAGVDRSTRLKVSYDFLCEDGPEAIFRVVRMRLMEDLNGGYALNLELATDDLEADTDRLLGASCQLDIMRKDHVRPVYGIVAAVDYAGHTEDRLLVSLWIVTAIQLLGHRQGNSPHDPRAARSLG